MSLTDEMIDSFQNGASSSMADDGHIDPVILFEDVDGDVVILCVDLEDKSLLAAAMAELRRKVEWYVLVCEAWVAVGADTGVPPSQREDRQEKGLMMVWRRNAGGSNEASEEMFMCDIVRDGQGAYCAPWEKVSGATAGGRLSGVDDPS